MEIFHLAMKKAWMFEEGMNYYCQNHPSQLGKKEWFILKENEEFL